MKNEEGGRRIRFSCLCQYKRGGKKTVRLRIGPEGKEREDLRNIITGKDVTSLRKGGRRFNSTRVTHGSSISLGRRGGREISTPTKRDAIKAHSSY